MIPALTMIWEAAGYPWSVRLQAVLPVWLPWARRRRRLSATVCRQLRGISPRPINRRLAPAKRTLRTLRYGRTKPGPWQPHSPLKTDHGDVTGPGFTELDLVAHAGGRADGEFAHSLNVTDIHTTWGETRAVLGRGEARVQAALDEIRQALPFRPAGERLPQRLGIHQRPSLPLLPGAGHPVHPGPPLQERRPRPPRAEELDSRPEAGRLWSLRHPGRGGGVERPLPPRAAPVPEPLPAVRQAREQDARRGAAPARYDAPRTPLDRLQVCRAADPTAVAAWLALRDQLDPFALSQAIDRKIDRLMALATVPRPRPLPSPPGAPTATPEACLGRRRRPPPPRHLPDFTFGNHLRRPVGRPSRVTS